MKEKTRTGLVERLKSGTGLLQEPMPPDELGKHIIVTYQRLRLGMGFIALFFSVIIVAVGLWYKIDFEHSYSAYYFGLPAGDLDGRIFPGIFPTRAFFCGLLFVLCVFLILYKGFNRPEDVLLMIAGCAAICVAIFPMWYDKMYPASDFKYEIDFRFFSRLHHASAVVLFSCMALVAWLCSKTTLKDEIFNAAPGNKPAATWADDNPRASSFLIAWIPLFAIPIMHCRKTLPTQKDTFVRNYNWIALAMALFPFAALLVAHLTQWKDYIVLLLEALGVWTFAAFWLLKSHELKLSKPEERAIRSNPLPGRPSKNWPYVVIALALWLAATLIIERILALGILE